MDGRYEEVYPDSTYSDIYCFTNGKEGWEEVLEKYDNNLILIRKKSPIYLNMKMNKEWDIVYEDDISVLYLPRERAEQTWVLPGKGGVPKDYFSTQGLGPYLTPTQP